MKSQSGQAALIAVIIIMVVTLTFTFGMVFVSYTNQQISRTNIKSNQSYFLAEAGIEDSLLRIIDPDLAHQTSNTITLNGESTTVNVSQTGQDLTITSEADISNIFRTVSTVLRENAFGGSFFYGIQVDEGGLTMSNNARVNGNVFSNGNITGSNGAVITGDATVAGGLDDAAQDGWTAHDSDQAFATASNNRDIAQSFTATEAGPLTMVSVYLAKVGNPTSNLNVRITTDNSGKPSTSSIATSAIAPSQVTTTADWIEASFTSPATLTQGTKYWIVLDYGSDSATNYWNWRKDSTGGYANNTGSYTSSWTSGSAVWTSVNGDLAFQAWIGGTVHSISTVTVGSSSSGSGRANAFSNATIHGSPCPNQYCLIENLDPEELPIGADIIQSWKDSAMNGGTHNGDYTLTNGAIGSLGPTIVTGNLNISNNAQLTLTGTVWVQGDIQLSNGCIIQLDSGYGENSGVLFTSGIVQISNNCSFLGSGDPASYIMLLSDKDDPANTVMDISNNSAGIVYYAPRGQLHFSNNATAKEATAYGIILDNGATITYESGLENITFTSGPAGGWDILSWDEIE